MKNKIYIFVLFAVALLTFHVSAADAEFLKQLTPILTISQEYTDNYYQTDQDKDDQFITTYQLSFSFAFLEQTRQIYVSYIPSYIDFDTYDEKDSIAHAFQIEGEFQPDKYTDVSLNIGYDGHSDIERRRESSSQNASILATRQLLRHLSFYASHDFSKSFDQQVRTGAYKTHTRNTTSTGLEHQFGENNISGLDYSFLSDDYEEADADEHQTHKISGDMSYWFDPFLGMGTALSYEKTTYEISPDDSDTLSGHLRVMRKMTRHFDVYLKYAHTITQQHLNDHQVYHPSFGFDWKPDEDSGISLGAGVLIHKWKQAPEFDSTRVFIDANIYRDFQLSPRGKLSVNGSSGYGQTDPDAASLGFNTYYQAEVLFDYQLTRRLFFNFGSSYRISSFREPGFTREDHTFENMAGLSWTPLKWMSINLSCISTRFDTDSVVRDNYTENQAILTVNIIPQIPLRKKE